MTQTNGHNERLDRVEAILDRMATQSEADRQQAAEEFQHLRESLATLTDITNDFMSVTGQAIVQLQQNVIELRAGQEQHSRMLDVLIRNQQNGQNGG